MLTLATSRAGGGDTASKLRGFCFYLWTLALSIPLFVVMLAMAPFVMLRDKVRRAPFTLCVQLYVEGCCCHRPTSTLLCMVRRNWQHEVNNIWARASTTPWYRVEVSKLLGTGHQMCNIA